MIHLFLKVRASINAGPPWPSLCKGASTRVSPLDSMFYTSDISTGYEPKPGLYASSYAESQRRKEISNDLIKVLLKKFEGTRAALATQSGVCLARSGVASYLSPEAKYARGGLPMPSPVDDFYESMPYTFNRQQTKVSDQVSTHSPKAPVQVAGHSPKAPVQVAGQSHQTPGYVPGQFKGRGYVPRAKQSATPGRLASEYSDKGIGERVKHWALSRASSDLNYGIPLRYGQKDEQEQLSVQQPAARQQQLSGQQQQQQQSVQQQQQQLSLQQLSVQQLSVQQLSVQQLSV